MAALASSVPSTSPHAPKDDPETEIHDVRDLHVRRELGAAVDEVHLALCLRGAARRDEEVREPVAVHVAGSSQGFPVLEAPPLPVKRTPSPAMRSSTVRRRCSRAPEDDRPSSGPSR